jgi:hypothetical protein
MEGGSLMLHQSIGPDTSPIVLAHHISALYALRKAAPACRLIAGRPLELIVQASDGRTWIIDPHGASHICDDLPSPYHDKPYARHPLLDLGCTTLGCDVRLPLTAEGTMLSSTAFNYASKLAATSSARDLVETIGAGLICPEHHLELAEVPRAR